MSTTKFLRHALVAALASAGLAACDSDSAGPGRMATLEVVNESTQIVQMVQIARCTDEFWGANRLGPNESMAPGAARSWQLEPGCWDVRMNTSSQSGEWWDIELQAGGSIRVALIDDVLQSPQGLQPAFDRKH